MAGKKLSVRERMARLAGLQKERGAEFSGAKPKTDELKPEPGSGISNSTRGKLEAFDSLEAELSEKQKRLIWADWHGAASYDEIVGLGKELAELPKKLDYYGALKSAAIEASTPAEKREVDVRRRELLYLAVARNPELLEAREAASKELISFRYEFSGQTMAKADLMTAWQSMSDSEPVISRAMYMEYLRQSATLQPIAFNVARVANQISREAGKELGMDVKTFADVVLGRNELSPAEFKDRVVTLLNSVKNLGEFLDEIGRAAGVKPSPLNDYRLVSQFLGQSGVLEVYPQSLQGSFGFFKHIMDMCGFFGEVNGKPYLDLKSFGDAPHFVSLELSPAAGAEEGALRFGKGVRDYVAGVNPGTKQDPRQYLAALAHETGHILHYDGMDRNDGSRFYKTDTEAFREAMAITVEALISDSRAISELGSFTPEDHNLVYLTSKFLDGTRMREWAIRGITELAMYEVAPAEVSEIYAHLLREFPVSPTDTELSNNLLGNSWGAEITLTTTPGASMEYALGHAIASTMLSSLSVFGGGSPIAVTTASILNEYGYAGMEEPWKARLSRLLEDTGQKPKPIMH